MLLKVDAVHSMDVKQALSLFYWKYASERDSHIVAVNGVKDSSYVEDYLGADSRREQYLIIRTAMIYETRILGEGVKKRFTERMRFFLGAPDEQQPFNYLTLNWADAFSDQSRVGYPKPLFKSMFYGKSLRIVSEDIRRLNDFLKTHIPKTEHGSLIKEYPGKPGEEENFASRLFQSIYGADKLLNEVYAACKKAHIPPSTAEKLARDAYMQHHFPSRILDCWSGHGNPSELFPERRG